MVDGDDHPDARAGLLLNGAGRSAGRVLPVEDAAASKPRLVRRLGVGVCVEEEVRVRDAVEIRLVLHRIRARRIGRRPRLTAAVFEECDSPGGSGTDVPNEDST